MSPPQSAALDARHEAAFDRVARVASRALGAPVAQFNVVTDDEQVSVSSVGPEGWRGRRAASLEASYCQHVVRTGNALVIDDARTHPLVCESRATTDSGIAAYVGVPVVLADGTVAGSLCVVDFTPRAWTAEECALLEDLAASVAAQLELARHAEAHARALAQLDHVLGASAAHLYVLALDGDQVNPAWVSASVQALLGYTVAEALAPTWWRECVHPDDAARTAATISLVRQHEAVVHEYRLRHRAGHYVWVHEELRLVRDAQGRPVEIVGAVIDISQRKAAEATLRAAHDALESRVAQRTTELTRSNAELRASEERFRAIFDQAAVGIATADPAGAFLRANARLVDVVGYDEAELCARTLHDITHPDDVGIDAELRARLLAGEIDSYQAVTRFVHKAGHVVWALLTMSVVRGADEAPDYFIGVIEDITESRRTAEDLRLAKFEIVERLAQAAEFRDDDTGQHTRRVGELSARLAESLGLPAYEVELLRRAAPLHDVGKIGIPDGVLLKPGRLTPDEIVVMQRHTLIGAELLAGGTSPLMAMAEAIARSHHERWDGAGYPERLAGEAIPLPARIVAVADVYDALTSDRPYRPAWPADRVVAEIERSAGTHFDPRVVRAFLDLVGPPAGPPR